MYYMGQLLPVFMFFYLVLAWFLYLKKTSFLAWSKPSKKPAQVLGHYESELARNLPEDKASGEQLRHLRDESGFVIKRQSTEDGVRHGIGGSQQGDTGTYPSSKDNRPGEHSIDSYKRAIGILLWSACQIAVLATVLYHWLGIGAKYF